MGKMKEIYNKVQNLPEGSFIYKNQKKVNGRNGDMYYLFFNDGMRSYRTCIDVSYRNYQKWAKLIKNIKRGDLVKGLRVKSRGMIDADSFPKYAGNIYNL